MRKIADLSRLGQILLAPLVSEKTTKMSSMENAVAFWVKTDATKREIGDALQVFFPSLEGKVEAVRTLILRPKRVKRGSILGVKNKRKKAYITLSEGSVLNFEELQ